MPTLSELLQEQQILSANIRRHVGTIPLPNRNKHADTLCDGCRPWFERSRQLVTQIYKVRNMKPIPSPLKKGIDDE